MADYKDIFGLYNNSVLLNKVTVAVVVAAADIFDESTPTAERLAWARVALESPGAQARRFFMYVLAQNKGLTVEQISGAGDVAIQNNVDSAVTNFIGV